MKKEEFKITDSHLKLLKNMYVSWSEVEFGAPEIDPKRPYGNSDVINQILEILGIPYDDEEGNEALEDFAVKIHKDMEIVLQICLALQSFETGTYIKEDEYGDRSWKKK